MKRSFGYSIIRGLKNLQQYSETSSSKLVEIGGKWTDNSPTYSPNEDNAWSILTFVVAVVKCIYEGSISITCKAITK